MTWHIFQGPSGNPEIGRVLLGLGGFNSIVSPVAFQAWALYKGAAFNVTEYCLAMSALLVALAPLLLSIGNKDRNTAEARQTMAQPPLEDTSGKGSTS